MNKYVLLALDFCVTTTTSFDLWMSRLGHGTFVLVINFIKSQWVPCHVIVGFFEVIDMVRIAMAMHVKDLLDCSTICWIK
jgi:ATP:corrinoid adenosyltransferase